MLNGTKDNDRNFKIINNKIIYDGHTMATLATVVTDNKNVNDKQVNSRQLNTTMSLPRYSVNRQSSKQTLLSLSPNPNSNNDNNSPLNNNKRNSKVNNMGSSMYSQKKSVVFEKPEISFKQVMSQLSIKRKSTYMPTKDLEQK